MSQDGIVNLNKPAGITSARALYRLRSMLRQRKSGHAGTLDPAATGVLLLCLGKATRLVERLMDQPKCYRARIRLDVVSKSHDLDCPASPVDVSQAPDTERLVDALRGFVGTVMQAPPRISAVKVGGVPAYRLADDQSFCLVPRPVQVYWIRLLHYAFPEVDVDICCGRGTYIRAIARDLGEALGTGGCLTALTRTAVGPFELEDAHSLEDAAALSANDLVIPLERARDMASAPVDLSPSDDVGEVILTPSTGVSGAKAARWRNTSPAV